MVASVHSAFNQSRDEMTARLLRAIANPYVNVIGHPTGRNVETFAGYDFDHDAVFAAAARTGTALEIDGQPSRLDLPSPLARRAKEFGVTFTCDSDAHGVAQLENVAYAVGQARRGWVTAAEVLNARPLEEVLAFVKAKRTRTHRCRFQHRRLRLKSGGSPPSTSTSSSTRRARICSTRSRGSRRGCATRRSR